MYVHICMQDYFPASSPVSFSQGVPTTGTSFWLPSARLQERSRVQRPRFCAGASSTFLPWLIMKRVGWDFPVWSLLMGCLASMVLVVFRWIFGVFGAASECQVSKVDLVTPSYVQFNTSKISIRTRHRYFRPRRESKGPILGEWCARQCFIYNRESMPRRG